MFGSKAKNLAGSIAGSTAIGHKCPAAQAVCYKFTMVQAVLLAFFLRDRRSDNKACRSVTNGAIFK